MLSGVARLIANHRSSASLQAHQKPGPFPPPALPGLAGTTAPSDSRRHRRPKAAFEVATLMPVGLPRLPASPFRRADPQACLTEVLGSARPQGAHQTTR